MSTVKPKSPRPESFDVTCVIGTVSLSEYGEDSPHVVAFKMIAEHDAPGAYQFPTGDGGTCCVEVSYKKDGDDES